MKNLRACLSLLFLAFFLAGATPSIGQTRSDENTNPNQGSAQRREEDGSSVSLGWVGLLGLAGLLGLRRNRKTTGLPTRTIVVTTGLLAVSATLYFTTPALSQPLGGGDNDENAVKTGQRDTGGTSPTYDWVGFFGLAGLVGLVGPRRAE